MLKKKKEREAAGESLIDRLLEGEDGGGEGPWRGRGDGMGNGTGKEERAKSVPFARPVDMEKETAEELKKLWEREERAEAEGRRAADEALRAERKPESAWQKKKRQE